MQKRFKIYLINRGLRSYIVCELCNTCPRGDKKGCCHYSPSFSLPDLVYLYQQHRVFLQKMLSMEGAVLEEYRLVVNGNIHKHGKTCRFHTANGCRLHPEQRDTVCRLYVCPGIGLWREMDLLTWQEFFGTLVQQEYELQELMAGQLQKKGLTLAKDPWQALEALALANFCPSDKIKRTSFDESRDFMEFPPRLVKEITRQISGNDWVV